MTIDGATIWSGVLSILLLVVGAYIRMTFQRGENHRESAKRTEERVLALEIKMVEEARVREIVNECIADIKQGQAEIRGDIKGLTGEIHELAQLMANRNING